MPADTLLIIVLTGLGADSAPLVVWLRAQGRIRDLEMTLLMRTTDAEQFDELRPSPTHYPTLDLCSCGAIAPRGRLGPALIEAGPRLRCRPRLSLGAPTPQSPDGELWHFRPIAFSRACTSRAYDALTTAGSVMALGRRFLTGDSAATGGLCMPPSYRSLCGVLRRSGLPRPPLWLLHEPTASAHPYLG